MIKTWSQRITPESTAIDQLRAMQGEINELRAELAESDALRDKMGGILTRSVNAIRGEPEPLSLHSWHDLPELIAGQMTEAAYQRMIENGKAWKFVET